ncbi:hypothetical protein M1N64_00005, partial [Peptococcaceae bacterium]|nr:hypothetical protein [Peptococcaceae bacterium]
SFKNIGEVGGSVNTLKVTSIKALECLKSKNVNGYFKIKLKNIKNSQKTTKNHVFVNGHKSSNTKALEYPKLKNVNRNFKPGIRC